jgi:uncharacterized protein YjiS (DUF1127 family)
MEKKMSTISSPAAQPSIQNPLSGIIRWAGNGALTLAAHLERRAAIKALRQLNDRELRDIGIMRCHIEAVVTGGENPELGRLR